MIIHYIMEEKIFVVIYRQHFFEQKKNYNVMAIDNLKING